MRKVPSNVSRFRSQTGYAGENLSKIPAERFRLHATTDGGAPDSAANPPSKTFATASAAHLQKAETSGRDSHHAAPELNLTLGVLVMSLIWIGPILACGSFQPRPAPTRQPVINVSPDTGAGSVQDSPAPAQTLPAAAPTQPPPTATAIPSPTPTIVVRNPLNIGDQARITVATGLNIREQPSTGAPVVVLLAQGKRVLVLEGPAASDGYVWWKIDDNQGNIGWVAGGDGEQEWISARIGEVQPVNRSPIVGDRVVVTLLGQLSVRALPGVDSVLVGHAGTNEQFSVVAGPQAADGYFWYQIRSDDRQVEGWAADGRDGERWLTPLE